MMDEQTTPDQPMAEPEATPAEPMPESEPAPMPEGEPTPAPEMPGEGGGEESPAM